MKIAIGDLELRPFEPGDTRALYVVRNHPSVLPYMTNPTPIPYRAHVAWVKANLIEGGDVRVFMIVLRGRRIGFSLLRRVGDETEIGLMVRDAGRYPMPSAYAALATLHYGFTVLGLDAVVSYALETHERALVMAQLFGAVRVECDKPGHVKFRLTRSVALAHDKYQRYLGRLQRRMVMSA